MKRKILQAWVRLKRFDRDESGEQNMSTVMLLGLGALVVVGLIAIGVYIFNYAKTGLENATDDPGFQTPN
jgi:hypothetical protein